MTDTANADESVPSTGIALPEEVASHMKTTMNRLTRRRSEGKGPAYVRFGRSIRYRWEDVHAFVEENLQSAVDEAATNSDSNDDDGGEVK